MAKKYFFYKLDTIVHFTVFQDIVQYIMDQLKSNFTYIRLAQTIVLSSQTNFFLFTTTFSHYLG